MNQSHQAFWTAFAARDFEQAFRILGQLPAEERAQIFEGLYQRSACQRTPSSLGLGVRRLKEGKTVEDFLEAWTPPPETQDPLIQGDIEYKRFFPAPVRVINALNLKNPSEIVSISFNWLSAEAQARIFQEANVPQNRARGDRLESIVDKSDVYGIYLAWSTTATWAGRSRSGSAAGAI
ncbi:MAG: hypothetical protein ACOYKZ_02975 [Chlamydiia bacterium]